jgi:hypothetical protein
VELSSAVLSLDAGDLLFVRTSGLLGTPSWAVCSDLALFHFQGHLRPYRALGGVGKDSQLRIHIGPQDLPCFCLAGSRSTEVNIPLSGPGPELPDNLRAAPCG